jgi:amino acid transporter
MTSKFASPLRKRMIAFFGATAVVTVLWLVAVVAVKVFAAAPPTGYREGRFLEGVQKLKLPPGTLPHGKGPVVALLHNTGGNQLNPAAWQTVVQILILISLAALVVAGIDGLRRKNRRRRRARTA